MEIREPIIVVGVGRCGSTLVQEVLAKHMAWISGLANRFPDRPALNGKLMRPVDRPGVGNGLRRRLRPSEHYHFGTTTCAASASLAAISSPATSRNECGDAPDRPECPRS